MYIKRKRAEKHGCFCHAYHVLPALRAGALLSSVRTRVTRAPSAPRCREKHICCRDQGVQMLYSQNATPLDIFSCARQY